MGGGISLGARTNHLFSIKYQYGDGFMVARKIGPFCRVFLCWRFFIFLNGMRHQNGFVPVLCKPIINIMISKCAVLIWVLLVVL